MRLDHLLSKEHLAPQGVQAPDLSECLSRLAHGWNIDIGAEPIGSNSVRLLQEGTVRVRKPRTCTLLGPEGPGLIQSDENWTSDLFLSVITRPAEKVPPVL